jgi:hypothetical protein
MIVAGFYFMQPDLRLERQGEALVVHAKHSGRWVGVLLGGFGLYVIWYIYGIEIPNQSVLALVAYWFGLMMIGGVCVGIGVFLLLPREVTTTSALTPRLPSCEHRGWLVRAPPHLSLRGGRWLAPDLV